MPIVPGGPNPISMDVPGQSTGTINFGRTGAAIAGLGGVVEGAANNLLADVKKAEAIDASDTAAFQDNYDAIDKLHQLKITYGDGYVTDKNGARVMNTDNTPRTITQEFRDWADERYKQSQGAMPSQVAQQMYVAKASRNYNELLLKAHNDELTMRVNSFENNQATKLKVGLNKLVDVPAVSDAYRLSDSMIGGYKDQVGLLIGEPDAHKQSESVKKEVPQSLFEGMYNAVIAQPKDGGLRSKKIDEAFSVLRGTDAESMRRKKSGLYTFSDSMDPDQKASIEKHLYLLKDQADKLDKSDIERKTQNALAALDIGQKVPAGPLVSGWTQLLNAGKIKPTEFADNVGSLFAKDKANELIKSPAFYLSSPEDKKKLIESTSEKAYQEYLRFLPAGIAKEFPSIGAPYRKEFMAHMAQAQARVDKLANDDFASFGEFSPQVRTYSASLDFSQPQTLWKTGGILKQRNDALQSLGDSYFKGRSPSFKLLKNAESEQLANFLTSDTVSYGAASDALQAIRTADPKSYGSVMDQVIKDNKLNPEWRLALVIPNQVLSGELIRTIRDGKKIREDASSVLQANSKSEKDMENAVEKAATGYLQGMTEGNQDSSIAQIERSAMRQLVTTKAMDLYSQDRGARGGLGEYAKLATEAVFATRYKNFQVGGGAFFSFEPGHKNSLLVPKVLDGRSLSDSETGNVPLNRSALLRDNATLKSSGIVPPKGMNDIDSEKFYDQVRSTGRLILNGAQDGYYLQYFSKESNSFVRAMSKGMDRNGRPIPFYIPLSRMLQEPPKPENGYKSDGSSFMDKLMNSITSVGMSQQ